MTKYGIDFVELKRRTLDKADYLVDLIPADDAGDDRAVITEFPLTMMKKRGAIDERQYSAGNILLGLFENACGGMSAPPYDGMSISGIAYGSKDGHSRCVMDAIDGLNHITKTLSPTVWMPLVKVCCHARSIADVYNVPKRGHAHTKAVSRFCLSLDLLAEII